MSKVSMHLPKFSQETATKIIEFVKSNISAQQMFFGGSYIRGCPMVGDIDLAVLRAPDTDASIERLIADFCVQNISGGRKQKRMVLRSPAGLPFQLDIWLIDDVGQWGPLCMFVAGDGQLNIIQRAKASQLGYMLSQYTVSRNNISVGAFPTERSVYQFFGWDWIGYTKRNVGTHAW